MSHRTTRGRRRGRASDPLETVKPLVVLGLLGMIVYGAATMVRGSASTRGASELATADPAPTPPTVDLPAEPVSAPIFAQSPSAPPNAAGPGAVPPGAAAPPTDPGPTYLQAQAAAAPVADPPAPQAAPPMPPPPAPAVAAPAPLPLAAAGSAPSPAPVPEPPVVLPTSRQASAPPSASSAFAAAWADAHEKLSAARYAEALSILSVWYDDPSLGPEESQRLDELLGQLAGTVVYSQQDLLLPPHVVSAGQTLQGIAAPLQVPWQLLAKINGVTDPSQLIPGEHLKLVRGPVDAVVSVSRRRLSLQVAGHYAGSFPVVLGRGVADRIGSSVALLDVRRGGPPGDPAARPSLVLADGLAIEAVDDPATHTDAAVGTTVLVAARDFAEMADILGPGSHILVRR